MRFLFRRTIFCVCVSTGLYLNTYLHVQTTLLSIKVIHVSYLVRRSGNCPLTRRLPWAIWHQNSSNFWLWGARQLSRDSRQNVTLILSPFLKHAFALPTNHRVPVKMLANPAFGLALFHTFLKKTTLVYVHLNNLMQKQKLYMYGWWSIIKRLIKQCSKSC